MAKDTPGKTTKKAANGKAKGVLFVADGNPIPPVPDGFEVIVVVEDVISDQVQRRT